MRVAMPVFRSRLSPLFDSAGKLLVVDIVGNEEVGRREVDIDGMFTTQKVRRLGELGVSTLVCGAISGMMYGLTTGRGITVIPWLRGEVEEVLEAFKNGRLDAPSFRVPGCTRAGGPWSRHGWAWRWGSGGEPGQGRRRRRRPF